MEYGLIGEKLGHSYSKDIHEMLADYTYDLCPLTKEEFEIFMEKHDFKSINVTIPYKQKVIPYLDEMDDNAKAIGAVNAWGYDLNAACSGFILALNTAQSYIRSGLVKTALVIGAEKMSRIVDWKDRGTCILFGDGAGAVVLRGEESESAKAVYTAMAHSAGDKGEALTLQYGTEETPVIRMDGQAVFKFAVRKVPEIIEEMLKKADVSREDVDYFVLHQANRRIIEAAAKRVGVEIEKFPMNLGEYANTSAASVPILLNEMNRDGKLKRGQKIILAGFGAGLTWAGCLMEW